MTVYTAADNPETILQWDLAEQYWRDVAEQLRITLDHARRQYPYPIDVAVNVGGQHAEGLILVSGRKKIRVYVEFNKVRRTVPHTFRPDQRADIWRYGLHALQELATQLKRVQ